MFLQVMSIVGALMVLAAYGLNQGGIWRELHAGYLTLNILGSLMLGVVAIVDQRAGFILLEFAWAGLGLIGVARAIRSRQQH
jgi:fluoride ion exporter CrcB/FEX